MVKVRHPEKYSEMNLGTIVGFLANALNPRSDVDGDTDTAFPRTDAEDLSCGAAFIPNDVTLARRAGKRVNFVTQCSPNCWYWEMPDGTRIYHFLRYNYEEIARANGHHSHQRDGRFQGDAGACPNCGNPHTKGGTVKPK